jgi:DNA-binding response OmpR family regulator
VSASAERSLTALVVDGNEPIRVLLNAFLSRSGFEVDTAPDIDGAVPKLRDAHFDVLVVDPSASRDGDAVTRIETSFPGMVERTIVIVSAPHQIQRHRVHAVIEKPFDLKRVLEAAIDCGRSHHFHDT